MTIRTTWVVAAFVMLAAVSSSLRAEDAEETVSEPATPTPATKPAPRTTLPDAHAYQRTLRAFMATLTEKDFDHGIPGMLTAAETTYTPDQQYRQHIYTMMLQPMVGTKRGSPGINMPPASYTLAQIELPDGVHRAGGWPEATASFLQWDYPGNPFHNSRALKLRAFVSASINLMMLDDFLEKSPGSRRSDWMGYQLVYTGVPYLAAKDVLPPEVQKAYETGIAKLARQIMSWGPKRDEPNLDMTAAVGVWYASKICNDPELTKEAEAYVRRLLTDPKYFHPAGYYLERGGLDVGFAGMGNFFAVWVALASDWPFAKDAVERAYRLRAHLMLPEVEPAGYLNGPSHFNSRTSSAASMDQWDWVFRDYAAAMLTDEAAFMLKIPEPETLKRAALVRAGIFNHALEENPGRHVKGDRSGKNLRSSPWAWHLWDTHGFPASVNFGYEFYKPGSLAHLLELKEKNSEMLKSPFLREGNFVRNFSDAFIVAKRPTFAAILHTGPVGAEEPGDGLATFKGPLGFGGGQLSAFWTPATGSVILGCRRGMNWDISFDTLEEWRQWPIHAVSGMTPDGRVFTSARIAKPNVVSAIKEDSGKVTVSGTLPPQQPALLVKTSAPGAPGKDGKSKPVDTLTPDPRPALAGKMDYSRTFEVSDAGVAIESSFTSDGKDAVAELYETIPVYLRVGAPNPKNVTTIEFQTGKEWAPATEEFQQGVVAARITKPGGAVTITFDRARRVKLSPAEWRNTYLPPNNVCRNVMVDLLENDGKSGTFRDTKKVSYRIEVATK